MKKYLFLFGSLLKSGNTAAWLFVIFTAAFLSTSPIYFAGIPSGHDLPQHFQFAQTYHDSIVSGDLFPAWSADENNGYGGIGTRFYPPLGYYSLAFARMLTGNWYDAASLNFFFWMFIGCIGIYCWAKEFFSPQVAGVAAVFYAFAPFHLAHIYQFWTYAEFIGEAILPFCFLFVTRVCRRGNLLDSVSLAALYSLLLLSHIPLGLIGSISLAIYGLVILNWQKPLIPLLKLSASVILGLLASSFHWIKVATEMPWLNHASPEYNTGIYNYEGYFYPFEIEYTGNFWATYFWLLLIVTTISIVSVLVPFLFRLVKPKGVGSTVRPFRAAFFTGLFSIFMATSLSSVIWQMFPILQKTQFPWRWFSIASMIGVIAFAGFIVPVIKQSYSRRMISYSVLAGSFVILFYTCTQVIIPSAPLNRESFDSQYGNLSQAKSFDCWWPIWAKKEALTQEGKVLITGREVSINKWDRENREFEISAGPAVNARIKTFYYPYWRAELNGQPTEIEPAKDGAITFQTPSEATKVKLVFEEPRFTSAAFYTSAITWIILLFGFIVFTLRRKNQAEQKLTESLTI